MKYLAFLLLFICISSCVTREEINAVIFFNNFNDEKDSMAGVCERNPEIRQYGFYRRLNDDKLEFFSVCNKMARNFLAVQKEDFNRLMDQALPKPRKTKD